MKTETICMYHHHIRSVNIRYSKYSLIKNFKITWIIIKLKKDETWCMRRLYLASKGQNQDSKRWFFWPLKMIWINQAGLTNKPNYNSSKGQCCRACAILCLPHKGLPLAFILWGCNLELCLPGPFRWLYTSSPSQRVFFWVNIACRTEFCWKRQLIALDLLFHWSLF